MRWYEFFCLYCLVWATRGATPFGQNRLGNTVWATPFGQHRLGNDQCLCLARNVQHRGVHADLALGQCLLQAGVTPTDSRDVVGGGGERFNVFNPVLSARGPSALQPWYTQYKANLGFKVSGGAGCCAAGSISFHYTEAAEARVLDALLHSRDSRGDRGNPDGPAGAGSGGSVAASDVQEWLGKYPHDWSEMGGYGAIPETAADHVWALLLGKMRPHLAALEGLA